MTAAIEYCRPSYIPRCTKSAAGQRPEGSCCLYLDGRWIKPEYAPCRTGDSPQFPEPSADADVEVTDGVETAPVDEAALAALLAEFSR